MLPQQRAELVVANLAEATLRIAAADDPAQLAVLATPVKRSLQQLGEHIAGFRRSCAPGRRSSSRPSRTACSARAG